MKCAACGSTALVEGKLGGGDASLTGFQPGDTPWLKRAFAFGNREIVAYACLHCNLLQLTVQFTEDDLQRYQQFEGEQPNVLERINSALEPKDKGTK